MDCHKTIAVFADLPFFSVIASKNAVGEFIPASDEQTLWTDCGSAMLIKESLTELGQSGRIIIKYLKDFHLSEVLSFKFEPDIFYSKESNDTLTCVYELKYSGLPVYSENEVVEEF
jgi:hypothetical protein